MQINRAKTYLPKIKEKIKKNNSSIEIELIVEPYSFIIKGSGNEDLFIIKFQRYCFTKKQIYLRSNTFYKL